MIRLGGFGVACAAVVLLGVGIRTHNWLSPSIAKQVSEVQNAGYSGAEARRWVAYKNVGAILESGSSAGSNNPSPSARGTESVAGSVLFSGAIRASVSTSTPADTRTFAGTYLLVVRNTPKTFCRWTPHSRSWPRAAALRPGRPLPGFPPPCCCERCSAGACFCSPVHRPVRVMARFGELVGDPVDAVLGWHWIPGGRNPDTAVTALHVVAGCQKITVYYEALKVTRPASVAKVLRQADLVLLKITDAPSAQVLVVDPKPPTLTDKLSTLGYPLQIRGR